MKINELNIVLELKLNSKQRRAAKRAAQRASATPTAQPTTEPTAQPTTEPTAQPTTEPTANEPPQINPGERPTTDPAAGGDTAPTNPWKQKAKGLAAKAGQGLKSMAAKGIKAAPGAIDAAGNIAASIGGAGLQTVGAGLGGLVRGYKAGRAGQMPTNKTAGAYRPDGGFGGGGQDIQARQGVANVNQELDDIKKLVQQLQQKMTAAGIQQ